MGDERREAIRGQGKRRTLIPGLASHLVDQKKRKKISVATMQRIPCNEARVDTARPIMGLGCLKMRTEDPIQVTPLMSLAWPCSYT